jgi:hypothetical protein
VQWRWATSCARAELPARRQARGLRRPPWGSSNQIRRGGRAPTPPLSHSRRSTSSGGGRATSLHAGGAPSLHFLHVRPCEDPCGRRRGEEEEQGMDTGSPGRRTWRRRGRLASRGATRAPPRGARLGLGETADGVDGEHRHAARPLTRGPLSPPPRGRGNQPPGWMHKGMQEAAGKPLLFGGVFSLSYLHKPVVCRCRLRTAGVSLKHVGVKFSLTKIVLMFQVE